MRSPLADLRERLPGLTLRDQHRLRRRIDGVRKDHDPEALRAVAERISAEITAAEERVARRRATMPEITYPAALPVSQKKDDLLAAIRDHQVVIVAGETGSGKTTQLPKICLELGRGVQGVIGHTQPRRLAARTVAERIAEELDTPLGGAVGYKFRFNDRSSEDTLVKLMTDGILLAEIQQDRLLRQYDTLIIDEAHERSLNIDFLLGYVKQLLPRRPDLKVIITSATIDPDRFARHFGRPARGPGARATAVGGQASGDPEIIPAPVIEVSGRTYPVEVRYRPLVADSEAGTAVKGGAGRGGAAGAAGEEERDQIQAIGDAVDELCAEGPGDILVFLSGEREIRDTADALAKQNLRGVEVLPLYARLSTADQHRVFQPHRGRRVVLATNVAETSLTVPGIKYVIDPGTARISRYSLRTKVQRLPIEAISQASADQRKGRCGRTSDGICIRLYSEDDFLSRPEFTDAEILRTNLASVILQMAAAGLGEMADFPFIDPPDRRNIKDGVDLLQELGALLPGDAGLTPLGRRLAQLPVDPRLARMVIEADRHGCAREVMIIVAALSIQDPRERPVDKQQAADERHARFADKSSDFLSYLNLWNHLQEQQDELSSSRFRRQCKAEFLHYLRVREWQDLFSQLRQAARSLGINVPKEAETGTGTGAELDPDRIHQSLLAGLLSHIGLLDTVKDTAGAEAGRGAAKKDAPAGPRRRGQEYLGARGAKFAIFPGSALFRKPPRWVMAAELVETSRLWGRIAARIEPEWVEPLAQHLVKRGYSEPHWELKQGAVMAYEKVTLYGVPIVAARKVNYGRIDPVLSRELFIRHALVDGEWRTHHAFFHDNRRLLDEVEDLEHRARRRDILVDDETLFEFYDERLPADVVSARHFDSWWKKAGKADPGLLDFEKSMLINKSAGGISEGDYPDAWQQRDLRLRLTYQFEPGTDADGVTVHVPLPVLNQVTAVGFDWQIPGLREELVTELIKSLPKQLRRSFVPAPDTARAVLARVRPRTEPLLDALERELGAIGGVKVPRAAWDLNRLPEHLRITFRVVDEHGETVAEDKSLRLLKHRLADQVRGTISAAADDIERRGLRGWTFGTLPTVFAQRRAGHAMKGYPALVDEGDSVAIRVLHTEAEQRQAMWDGTRRLVLLNVPSPAKAILGRLDNRARLALGHNPHRTVADLLDDCVGCATDKIITDAGGPVWDEEGFAKLLDRARAELPETAAGVVSRVVQILAVWHAVEGRLKGTNSFALVPSLSDVRAQLSGLIHQGFVTETGWRRLPDLLRYLRAIERRLDKLPENPNRDRLLTAQLDQVRHAYRQRLDRLPPGSRPGEELTQIRWLIEELRVSYFAQELGTPVRVSDKRILQALTTAR